MSAVSSNQQNQRVKKIKCFKLFEHQDAVAKHLEPGVRDSRIVVVNACRQVGKSWLAVAMLLNYSKVRNTTSAFVTITFRLARETFDFIYSMLYETGIIKKVNAQDLVIQFINGSSIAFFSAEQRERLRGYTVSGILVIDEAAFISDYIYYDYLRPWTNVYKSPTLILSTPNYEQGFFYELLTRGYQRTPGIIAVNFMDYPQSLKALRSDSVLDEARKNLPAQTFRSEYLGLFKRAEGSVFGNFEPLILKHEAESPTSMYFGIDWSAGTGSDYTVVSAFNQRHELCYLWRDNTLKPVEQVKKIAEILKRYEDVTDSVMAEKNSIGEIYLSMLRKMKFSIIGFNTDKDSKRRIVETMQVDIGNEDIRFLDDQELKQEFSAFEARVFENKIKYGAPPGMHDDIVMSVLIANWCYHKRKSKIKCLL